MDKVDKTKDGELRKRFGFIHDVFEKIFSGDDLNNAMIKMENSTIKNFLKQYFLQINQAYIDGLIDTDDLEVLFDNCSYIATLQTDDLGLLAEDLRQANVLGNFIVGIRSEQQRIKKAEKVEG